MANRPPLDPFGDGSLQHSWTFTDEVGDFTLNSQQNNGYPFPSGSIGSESVHDYNTLVTSTEIITPDCMPSGSQDYSFCCWINTPDGANGTLCFGEYDQRYNVSLHWQDSGSDMAMFCAIHKDAESTAVNMPFGWHHWAYIYEDATTTGRWYRNGVEIVVTSTEMKFNASKGVSVLASALNSDVTDILMFSKKLTLTELDMIRTDTGYPNITVTPDSLLIQSTIQYDPFPLASRGLDPFEDGSLISSFGCNYSYNNDQGTATLEGSLPYTSITYDRYAINAEGVSPTLLTSNPLTDNYDWSFQFTTEFDVSMQNAYVYLGSFIFNFSEDNLHITITDWFDDDITIDSTIVHTITLTYDGETAKFFIDDSKVSTFYSSEENIPIVGKPLSVETGEMSTLAINEILFFNRELTESEALYANSDFSSDPSTIITPFSLYLTTYSLYDDAVKSNLLSIELLDIKVATFSGESLFIHIESLGYGDVIVLSDSILFSIFNPNCQNELLTLNIYSPLIIRTVQFAELEPQHLVFKVNYPSVNGCILVESSLFVSITNIHLIGLVENLSLIRLPIILNEPTLMLSPIKDNSSVYFKLDMLDVVINSIETNVGRSEILDFVLTAVIPPHTIIDGNICIVKPTAPLIEALSLATTYSTGASTEDTLDLLNPVGGMECFFLMQFDTSIDQHQGVFPYYYSENMQIDSNGRFGNALYSDGTDTYSYSYFVEGDGDIGGTIDAFQHYFIHFKQEEAGDGGIIRQADNDNGFSSWDLISYNGTFQVGIFDGGTEDITLYDTGIPVVIGEWYFISAYVTASPTVIISINDTILDPISIKFGNYLSQLVIGSAYGDFTGSGMEWLTLKGWFDQFRVFDGYLTNLDHREIIKNEASLIFDSNVIAYRDYPINLSVISNELPSIIPDDELILVGLFTLPLTTFFPTYIGERTGVTPKPQETNKVYAQSIPLSLVAHYLQHPDNEYVKPQTIQINLISIQPPMWVRVLPETLSITVSINSSIAQYFGRDKRVTKIGDVEFDRALYWTKNSSVDNFIATTSNTVDGNTIYSVSPLKKYTRSYLISTKSDIIVDITKIDELKAIVNTGVITIWFNDGSWEDIKLDLIGFSIRFNPIFLGSDKYYLHIGVLL